MASRTHYHCLGYSSPGFWLSSAACATLALAGAGTALYLMLLGHHVTGMGTQLVWGIPHVFALTLILTGAGALAIAASSQVTKLSSGAALQPLTRLGAIVASALLIGGLAVLVFDLGRPLQLPVTFQHFNFSSSFARNILFYLGFFAIVGLLLWTQFDPAMRRFSRAAGWLAIIWPLLLAANVGSIFALLSAHEAYRGGLMIPLLFSAGLTYGSAALLLAWLAVHYHSPNAASQPVSERLSSLLALFIGAHASILIVHVLSMFYMPAYRDAASFLLIDGGIYPVIFWLGQVLTGMIIPSLLLLSGVARRHAGLLAITAGLVLLGGLAHLFVMVVGAQAHPLSIFPGYEVTGAVFDGEAFYYSPSLWEWLLGISGAAIATLIVLIGLRILPLTPYYRGP
ncbi:polysulfide reductase NrfD [Halorhodospira halochloris]|uniref:Sulfite reduction-associated complex DsrMKJOP protein DsrP n=1 Tax=Halorhodospira halochloris TaxID=1052 RepID=A0A110B5J5_HALHR|nr:NrfD/PsrC family molybdoenzyme membrane anchor subunit [Halorhodospira halochloris]MBK1652202.1 hypothetical protein [Halorhodospira halochloris]MCG5531673.1 polysulfide reductase NrfD [Halorhodospira halochloris]BAU58377.1 sulfite reduction-associated complex DsrMKJOP protein DsrP [Halorhodospira halochloris]